MPQDPILQEEHDGISWPTQDTPQAYWVGTCLIIPYMCAAYLPVLATEAGTPHHQLGGFSLSHRMESPNTECPRIATALAN